MLLCRAGVHGLTDFDAGGHMADAAQVSQVCAESVQGYAAAPNLVSASIIPCTSVV